ncbi:MAG: diphthine--ammonia ligase [Thermoplasmatota archaeon]
MKCVALLSGGKDSVAAVEVAQGHGWDVPVGLRMVPEEDDAYMFHTPNLDLVVDVASCMGMELVTASARPDPWEEVGDLERALARIKEDFQVDAIISGALASEYQRTRIDRIGARLGLKTFAPLWHKRAGTYMEGLVQAYDVRFSRVAADGLDASWAGARLDEARLAALRGMRLHEAGEGGEYETLVLDAPHYHKRIVIDDASVEETASRSTWRVTNWHVESK